MRIVIDLQGAQTASRFRGIGRYTVALVSAMVKLREDHEVILALNGLYADTIEPIRAAFSDLLPMDNIRVWGAVGPVSAQDSANNGRRKVAELIRESFLSSLKPDVVLISSLFEGFDENAVTSIGSLGGAPTATVLYDLIPLIYSKAYLQNATAESWYESKLDHLRRADLLLSISASSGYEAVEYLGFPEQLVVNISTACDSIFQPMSVNESQKKHLSHSYGITKPFVLYTGGVDQRKNIDGLFSAFAQMPDELQQKHQLVLVGRELLELRGHFINLAQDCGITENALVLTGYVEDDELALLYNACTLFAFPSWHEGFGLPVLEAMNCGRAVIAANASSLPEVVGREDALFPPRDDAAMSAKMAKVLTNDNFRAELEHHSLEQAKKFSWDETARRAWGALYALHIKHQHQQSVPNIFRSLPRPRLAYISPLPPERTGIADYSAELLPELSRHYDIDVIVAQETITYPWVIANSSVRDVDWFVKNSHCYDRVLYHFGNSEFHTHMFNLLAQIPGVVVLHDFFLSGVMAWTLNSIEPNGWIRELYHAHGYRAVQERFHAKDLADVVWKYPCNKTVIENAQAVIVHSANSRRLARHWLGETFAKDWYVIPHLRVPSKIEDKSQFRRILGFKDHSFIVCSFGFMGATKQNQRLLNAWLASSLSKDDCCFLVFVGENDSSTYGTEITATIKNSGIADRIHITGWTDMPQFRQYLAVADVGVQLRTLSRGETSGTVLDCMNYGVPTIVNANGSMADLPADAVWILPDEFDDADLTKALETLWKDEVKRNALGKRAHEVILTQHAPHICANQYAQVIESYYAQAQSDQDGLIKAIANIEDVPTDEQEWIALAQSIAQNQPPTVIKQLLVDVSALVQQDLKTGIQRVVRSILVELLNNPPDGYRVEPVYASGHEPGYRYAREFTLRFLECPDHVLVDETVEVFNGDIFMGLDLQPDIVPQQADFYAHLKHVGGQVFFIVYDLLPVLRQQMFPEGTHIGFSTWLTTIAQADGITCISRAVADEMVEWLSVRGDTRLRPFKLGWFHLGADVTSSVPTTGFPVDAVKVLSAIARRSTFLMVGTIEPRKGYLQSLSAFEELWAQGMNLNLVIVGSEGWKPLPDSGRRTIPETIAKIKNHPELNRRLFWLNGISDEYLEKVYAESTCLIVASEGEGFGLPLIEATQYKLPIIARDIPVFREVAGTHAFYFSGLEAGTLAGAVREWLTLNEIGQAPQSNTMPWLTWKQSTQNLLDVILGGQWYREWMSDGVYRFWGADSRLSTEVGERNGHNIISTGKTGFLIYGHYIPFLAGQYLVSIQGAFGENGPSGAWMDVASDKDNLIIGRSMLNMPDENGSIVSFLISLDESCTDLEVRIWVSEHTDLQVSMIEIAPWQDEPEIGNADSQQATIVGNNQIEKNAKTAALASTEVNKSAKLSNVSQPTAPKNRKNKKTQHNKRS